MQPFVLIFQTTPEQGPSLGGQWGPWVLSFLRSDGRPQGDWITYILRKARCLNF